MQLATRTTTGAIEVFKVPTKHLSGGSLVYRTMLGMDEDANPGPIDANVSPAVMAYLAEFLAKSYREPIKRIERPLKSRCLKGAGIPPWAVEFIRGIPLGALFVDVLEGARIFRIEILFQLGCARIASDVMYAGVAGLDTESLAVSLPLSVKQELRTRNSYFFDSLSSGVVKNEALDDEANLNCKGTLSVEQSESAAQALHAFGKVREGWGEGYENFKAQPLDMQLELYCSEAEHTRPDVVQYLLQQGADANLRCCSGETVMHRICADAKYGRRGNRDEKADIVELLIKYGASVNARSSPANDARTVLFSALDHGDVCCPLRIIQALLNAGADPLALEIGYIPEEIIKAERDIDADFPGSPVCPGSPLSEGFGYSGITDWSYFTTDEIDDDERLVRAKQMSHPLISMTSAVEKVDNRVWIDFDGSPLPEVPEDVRRAVKNAGTWPQGLKCCWAVVCTFSS